MSSTPNDPQNPESGVPGPYGQSGSAQPGQPQPYGQGAVNGAPQGGPNAQPSGQQYGQAGGKYGTAEYNPGQYTGTMERPAVFDRLLKLTLVSLGLSVLSSILSFIGLATMDMDAALREQGTTSTEVNGTDATALVGIIGTGSIIAGLAISVGLYLLVYFNLKKARNWARILGTVFAAISVVLGIIGLFGDAGGMSTGIYIAGIVLGIIKIVVDILWIVTAFKAPNTAWFNQNQVQR